MIYLYGDSHAHFSFKGLTLPYIDLFQPSITMHRIGRDNIIINQKKHNKDDIICISYGEIDCRCHIQRQKNAGYKEDDIIDTLITNYFRTINNNITEYKYIIVVGIIPPTKQRDYESLHGPITHEFPFVGSDIDRVCYTNKMNLKIKDLCSKYNYIYFNPYDYYTHDDGTLKYELSDKIIHIGDTTHFINEFTKLYNDIIK